MHLCRKSSSMLWPAAQQEMRRELVRDEWLCGFSDVPLLERISHAASSWQSAFSTSNIWAFPVLGQKQDECSWSGWMKSVILLNTDREGLDLYHDGDHCKTPAYSIRSCPGTSSIRSVHIVHRHHHYINKTLKISAKYYTTKTWDTVTHYTQYSRYSIATCVE